MDEITVHSLKLNVYPLFLLSFTFIVPKLTLTTVPMTALLWFWHGKKDNPAAFVTELTSYFLSSLFIGYKIGSLSYVTVSLKLLKMYSFKFITFTAFLLSETTDILKLFPNFYTFCSLAGSTSWVGKGVVCVLSAKISSTERSASSFSTLAFSSYLLTFLKVYRSVSYFSEIALKLVYALLRSSSATLHIYFCLLILSWYLLS